jgi:hypothetical protein
MHSATYVGGSGGKGDSIPSITTLLSTVPVVGAHILGIAPWLPMWDLLTILHGYVASMHLDVYVRHYSNTNTNINIKIR